MPHVSRITTWGSIFTKITFWCVQRMDWRNHKMLGKTSVSKKEREKKLNGNCKAFCVKRKSEKKEKTPAWPTSSTELHPLISPYSFRLRENADQKKLRIWTLFTQWPFFHSDQTLLSITSFVYLFLDIFWVLYIIQFVNLSIVSRSKFNKLHYRAENWNDSQVNDWLKI